MNKAEEGRREKRNPVSSTPEGDAPMATGASTRMTAATLELQGKEAAQTYANEMTVILILKPQKAGDIAGSSMKEAESITMKDEGKDSQNTRKTNETLSAHTRIIRIRQMTSIEKRICQMTSI